jgi:hypothetical protein
MNEKMTCPLCNKPVRVQRGTQMNPVDGYTVDCINPLCGMDTSGHGKDEKGAYEIYKQKCGITGREKKSDTGDKN